MDFVFGFQTLWLQDFSIIYQLKGLKPKTNGRTNFYECCNLTKKVYLTHCVLATHRRAHLSFQLSLQPPPSFLFWLLVIPLEESASSTYLSKSLIQFDMTNNHQHSSLLRLLVNSFLRHHIDTTRYLVLILVYCRRQSSGCTSLKRRVENPLQKRVICLLTVHSRSTVSSKISNGSPIFGSHDISLIKTAQ